MTILPIASVDKTKKTRSHDPGDRFGTVLANSRMISIGDPMNDSTNKLGRKALQQVHIGKCDFSQNCTLVHVIVISHHDTYTY